MCAVTQKKNVRSSSYYVHLNYLLHAHRVRVHRVRCCCCCNFFFFFNLLNNKKNQQKVSSQKYVVLNHHDNHFLPGFNSAFSSGLFFLACSNDVTTVSRLGFFFPPMLPLLPPTVVASHDMRYDQDHGDSTIGIKC